MTLKLTLEEESPVLQIGARQWLMNTFSTEKGTKMIQLITPGRTRKDGEEAEAELIKHCFSGDRKKFKDLRIVSGVNASGVWYVLAPAAAVCLKK